MQRCQRLRWCDWLRLLLVLQIVVSLKAQFVTNGNNNLKAAGAGATMTSAQNVAPYPNYFFMDLNGSYKYAFDTGSGIASEQSANPANEVTGQYSYFENGVPYMVKYKAGVQGYQAEIIPRDNVATETAAAAAQQTKTQTASDIPFGGAARKLPPTQPLTTNAIDADINQLLQEQPRGPGSNAGGGGTVSTLQFVQDAMQTMQKRPLQVSFTSQQGFGLPAVNSGGSFGLLPQSIGPAPVTNAEIQQINALAANNLANPPATTATRELRRQPYEFSYLSQQSSRTESADKSGNVVGKYSYYDDAGFHDLTYKAGDDIGFVVLGGSLAASRDVALTNRVLAGEQRAAPAQVPAAPTFGDSIPPNDPAFLIVNVQQQPNVNYNYRVVADPPPPPLSDRRRRRNSQSPFNAINTHGNHGRGSSSFNQKPDNNGRSLRKFRRNANW